MLELISRLAAEHRLTLEEYERLVSGQSGECARHAASLADSARRAVYGTDVYIRGLIEIGNVCRNDCYYCGIRRSNADCERYVLGEDTILGCCAEGYSLGFRSFVLQGGEGVMPTGKVCALVSRIRAEYPDCAITLSLGEYPAEDYRRMREAGADRYLLRHETADRAHYRALHPPELTLENRMRCLLELKELGFQVGCGFMVGSPHQTARTLAKDLKFIESFQPDMCGIGPFMPHRKTPLRDFPAGTAEQTIYLLSLIRLIKPNILLPATTALGSVSPDGRERALCAGANVIMPNLSPYAERSKYSLYDNKLSSGRESAQNLALLKSSVQAIGYRIVTARGDIKKD